MDKETAIANASEIVSLYQRFGAMDYIGEPVSQIEHMCQCAQLIEKQGYDIEMILAAFFHDIGHLCEQVMQVEDMDGYGTVDHEKLGADYIRNKGFSEKIANLIKSHVPAKRYLTYAEAGYFAKLSEASKITLEHQGGVMTPEEAENFRNDPLFDKYIALRKCDEQAKEKNIPLPLLDHYMIMMVVHLMAQEK